MEQQRTTPLRIVLVGAGALGSEIARLLLESSHISLLVVDPDLLEARNLALSALFTTALAAGQACLGQGKAELIARLGQRAGLDWQAHPHEIADVSLTELQAYDLLLTAPDSTLARAETIYAARTLRLPMIDAAVAGGDIPEGRVTWFPPTLTAACTLCGLSEARRAELLAYACSPARGCHAPLHVTPMSGPVASMRRVAATVLSRLEQARSNALPQSSFSARIHLEPSQDESIELIPSPACPWHDLPDPGKLVTMAADETPHDLLMRATSAGMLHPVLDLPWPICLRARCRSCGLTVQTRHRTALVRRRVPCPGCGDAGTLEPEEQVATIRPADLTAHMTARQLGLPILHLYRVRSTVLNAPGNGVHL